MSSNDLVATFIGACFGFGFASCIWFILMRKWQDACNKWEKIAKSFQENYNQMEGYANRWEQLYRDTYDLLEKEVNRRNAITSRTS